MSKIDRLKEDIIVSVKHSDNEELLLSLYNTINSKTSDDKIHFTPEQLEIIAQGEKDIDNNDIISNEDLEELDKEWMS